MLTYTIALKYYFITQILYFKNHNISTLKNILNFLLKDKLNR